MGETDYVRGRLGILLISGSGLCLLVLAIIIIYGASISKQEGAVYSAAQLLLASILPMFGTWVGTVLAFYYTKENFEVANRNTRELVRDFSRKLASTSVTAAMIPRAKIVTAIIPAEASLSDLAVSEIEQIFQKSGANGQPLSRLLITTGNGSCVAVLHRSVFMEAKNDALAATPPLDLPTADLGALLSRPCANRVSGTYIELVQTAFACVAQYRSVADAKAAMESIPGCQDVVITANGIRSEAMLGWISNIDIGRLSQA